MRAPDSHRRVLRRVAARLIRLIVVAAAGAQLAHGAAFVYAPVGTPITSASFAADFAGLTAHRSVAGFEVNHLELVAGGVALDLSDALFGTADVLADSALIDQGELGTGLVLVPVAPAFFPALASGAVTLVGTLTDTFDGLFAIDFFSLVIEHGGGMEVAMIDTDNGFGIGLPNGAMLPAPMPLSIPIDATGTGFDEAVASISFQAVPVPGSLPLVVLALVALMRMRRQPA
jgi:hypothetical protein